MTEDLLQDAEKLDLQGDFLCVSGGDDESTLCDPRCIPDDESILSHQESMCHLRDRIHPQVAWPIAQLGTEALYLHDD
jgi:hypothetical protein